MAVQGCYCKHGGFQVRIIWGRKNSHRFSRWKEVDDRFTYNHRHATSRAQKFRRTKKLSSSGFACRKLSRVTSFWYEAPAAFMSPCFNRFISGSK